jgi:PAS domain S-box-containing protein
MKVLIVDDNPTNLYLLRSLLTAHGHEVASATDGNDALGKPDIGSFDLIISDILMPGMDGYRLCREIKMRAETKNIPFIFYTATYTEEKDRDFALKLGAARFVLKPEEPEKFMAMIDGVIRERAEGRLQPQKAEMSNDMVFLTSYNDRLAWKIEDKLNQLQRLKSRLRSEIMEKNSEALERTQAEAALHLVEDRYKNVFENAVEGMFRATSQGRFISVNPALAEMLGFDSPAALVESATFSRMKSFLAPAEADEIAQSVATGGVVRHRETSLTLPDGSRIWVLLNLRTIRDDSGEILLYEGSAVDISARKRAEETLREREAFVDAVIENIPDMIFVKDAATLRFVRVNRSGEDFLGIFRDELYGKTDADFFPEEEAKFFAAKDREALEKRMLVDIPEETLLTRTHGQRTLHTKKIPLLDGKGNLRYLVGISEDITEKKNKDQKILASLKEKEVLLRELYHRTKNNMQVVISILSLQERNLGDPRLSPIFRDLQTRIRAMSLVHQKLYQSKDLSSIDFRSYIGDLLDIIMRSYLIDRDKISTRVQVQPMSIMVDTAVPCGLILHELISNAIKHAFPGDRSGRISIRGRKIQEEIEFVFSDNGVGLPEGFDIRDTSHVGLETVVAIVEHQLQGRIELKNEGGVTYLIRFPDSSGAKRI